MQSTLAGTGVFSQLRLAHLGLLLLLFVVFAGQALAQSASYVPGRLLVKFRSNVSAAQAQSIINASGARVVGQIPRIGVRVLQLPPNANVVAAARALRQRAEVQFAEPDLIRSLAQVAPNDPQYPVWHLTRIEAPFAWQYSRGSDRIIIAVLDSGVEASHPDLSSKLVPGWNMYDNNSDTSDVVGHGTSVAGVVAAATNNATGIAAVAWNCRIMPIRVTTPTGVVTDSMLASGLVWAADRGARVANLSIDMSIDTATVNSAMAYFVNRGGVVVGAAGNSGRYYSNPDNPHILLVSATDSNDVLASFSNRGDNIDVSAPGVSIRTTVVGGRYGGSSGTSFATPIVAGIAALLLSYNPNLTPQQVQDIIKQSADDLGAPGWDPEYGWGRVNARRALEMVAGGQLPGDSTPPSVSFASPANGATVSGTVSVQVNASDNVGVASVSLYVNNTLLGTRTTAPYTFSWDTTRVSNGSYTLRAVAADAAGNSSSAQISVNVSNQVDTTPPTVTITSPANGARVSNNQRVDISASDDRGVSRVELYVNGRLVATLTSAPYTVTLNTRRWAAGAHTLQARAYDLSGNMGQSATITVYK